MKRVFLLFLLLIGLMLSCGEVNSECTHTTICDGYVSSTDIGRCPIIVAAGCYCTETCR